MAGFPVQTAKKLSIASTVVDAGLAFLRGQRKRAVILLGAAALSARVPGFGTAVSVLSRLNRWLR